jgi:sugar transferase (PEP-CTERM/EpsH1 system associated)
MSLEVLFLSPRLCWPLDSGRRLREFHLAKAVSRRANLTILTFGDHDSLTAGDVTFCRMIPVPPPRRYSPGNVLRGLAGETPLPVLNYTSALMQEQLARLVAERRFDIVQVESIALTGNLAPLHRTVPPGRIVYDWHDIESERLERYSREGNSAAKRLYARLTAHRMRRLERAILTSGSAHLVCSEPDQDKLAVSGPTGPLRVVPNGVDVESFSSVVADRTATRSRVLFVGAMNYDPNIQAACDFADHVWPRVRSRFPDLRFTIVGSSPTAAVQALDDREGIEVAGSVPDVRPYYREAFCAVVPLRVGTGTRLKILEAMAAGVPVIATAIGAEGLPVRDGENFLLAHEPAQWEAAIQRLVAEPALRTALQAKGLATVGEHFDWQTIGSTLLDFYDALVSDRGASQAALPGRTFE